MVADAASTSTDPTSDPPVTAATVAGALGLVAARLRDLGRVVSGELDPGLLRATHNAVEPEAVDDAGDITFRAWGPKRRAAHARRELTRAERDLARTRP